MSTEKLACPKCKSSDNLQIDLHNGIAWTISLVVAVIVGYFVAFNIESGAIRGILHLSSALIALGGPYVIRLLIGKYACSECGHKGTFMELASSQNEAVQD